VKPTYDVLVTGNSLRLKDDFLGMSSITLIHSADGLILFDTGGYVSRFGLVKRLRERGLAPSDISTVFLSHLHFDHAHNIDLFPNARFIVSQREWDYAAAPHPDDILMPWGIHDWLSSHRLDLIGGEGSLAEGVSFFPAPGHTPGCYAIQLDTAEHGCVIVAGDSIKYPKEAILRRCDVAFDTLEAGTQTIKRILAVAERIVPGHFPELIRQPDGAFSWDDEASFPLQIR